MHKYTKCSCGINFPSDGGEMCAICYKKEILKNRDSLEEKLQIAIKALEEITKMYKDTGKPVLDHWGMLVVARESLNKIR